jgi:hypothetical protein
MVNQFETMAKKIAELRFQNEMEKIQSTSKQITEMLESYDFITDAFSDVEFLKDLITIKVSQIIAKNHID